MVVRPWSVLVPLLESSASVPSSRISDNVRTVGTCGLACGVAAFHDHVPITFDLASHQSDPQRLNSDGPTTVSTRGRNPVVWEGNSDDATPVDLIGHPRADAWFQRP